MPAYASGQWNCKPHYNDSWSDTVDIKPIACTLGVEKHLLYQWVASIKPDHHCLHG